ncbi:hypothetical protein GIB67_041107, partial [Kingdonia uniflora]
RLKMGRFVCSLLIVMSLILAPICVISLNPTLNDDVLGLIVFKADLQDPHSKLVSWNEDNDSPCNWGGVTCNSMNNRVSELVLDGFELSGRIGRGLLRLEYLHRLSLSRNNFTGTINPNIPSTLQSLRVIDFSENNLSGSIPDEFFRQCGRLRAVSFANNKLSGEIPRSLGKCSSLAAVNFSSNQLSGSLPAGISSLSELRSLDLSGNFLEGEIPQGLSSLQILRTIVLRRNGFSGGLPDDIGGFPLLKVLDFSENRLSGSLPDSLQKLNFCSYMSLLGNLFTGDVPAWIGDIESLQMLDLSQNAFSGQIPDSMRYLGSLKYLNLSKNRLTGGLPDSLINCRSLLYVDFSQNLLIGNLPSWVFGLGLQTVLLSDNKLTGVIEIPYSTSVRFSSQNLQALDLSSNQFSGEIPSNIGVFSNLQFLNMSRNSLFGAIPMSVGELKALAILDLSGNRLNMSIPIDIGGAVSLKELRLEKNFLAGNIPTQIVKFTSLTTLFLAQNKLTGPVPAAIAKLIKLQFVDLSVNSLTGSLPKQLVDLPNLISFNVSHNHLEGELPAGGFFSTISPSSVSDNPSLCRSVVNSSCNAHVPKPLVLNPNASSDHSNSNPFTSNRGHKKIIFSISALIAIGAAAFIALGVVAVTLLNLHVRSSTTRSAAAFALSGGDDFSRSQTTDANSGKLVMFSGDPDFSAGAHALLNKDCELGRGGFGAVYKTSLRDGRPVAIKKLTVSSLVKSQEDFEKEVKKLGKIRHQNLVALEGYYWTQSLQLIIYEFVPHGNLYKHLHEGPSGQNSLSWHERFNIILGTAKSLSHLHQHNIIHYNLKSSNVLIDNSGEPKVGDFGLVRLLPMLDRYIISSKIQSALGYMAPEFACQTVKITEKCDVYGFGVLILEIVTGKRPVEYLEDDVIVLSDVVRGALEEGRVEDCVDERMQGNFPAEEAIPVMKLGLICTSQVPSNRPDMGEVVNILELIRCPSEGQDELV